MACWSTTGLGGDGLHRRARNRGDRATFEGQGLEAHRYPHHPSSWRPCRRQPGAQGEIGAHGNRHPPMRRSPSRASTKVSGGAKFAFAGREVRVIDTPGHTGGHIGYYITRGGHRLRRRHAVRVGLRPGDRRDAWKDVAVARQAAQTPGRHRRLLPAMNIHRRMPDSRSPVEPGNRASSSAPRKSMHNERGRR